MKRINQVVRVSIFLATTAPLVASDASFYGIAKLQHFTQTNASAATALPSNGWAFAAFVFAHAPFAVTNATVKPSTSAPLRSLILDTNGGLILGYTNQFNTQSALDAAYPTSSGFLNATHYTNTLATVHDGLQSGVLSFYLVEPLVSLSYPNTPHLANFDEAQSVDTSRDFPLRWDTPGGGALEIVQVLLSDASGRAVFSSPAPLGTGALTGNSNLMVVPAYALAPGTAFTGELLFANPGLPNTNSYPGVYGVPVFGKDVVFPLATRPLAQPRLGILPPVSGQFHLRTSGESNRIYQVLGSTNFTVWDTLLSTNSATGVLDFLDPQGGAFPQRFYRVQVGP